MICVKPKDKKSGKCNDPLCRPCSNLHYSHATRELVRRARALDPNMPAIQIAERIGITRERVRQILIKLGFHTRVDLKGKRRAKL